MYISCLSLIHKECGASSMYICPWANPNIIGTSVLSVNMHVYGVWWQLGAQKKILIQVILAPHSYFHKTCRTDLGRPLSHSVKWIYLLFTFRYVCHASYVSLGSEYRKIRLIPRMILKGKMHIGLPGFLLTMHICITVHL